MISVGLSKHKNFKVRNLLNKIYKKKEKPKRDNYDEEAK